MEITDYQLGFYQVGDDDRSGVRPGLANDLKSGLDFDGTAVADEQQGRSALEKSQERRLLSLGIHRSPVFYAFVEGTSGSITSQIAVKMSGQAMLERAFAVSEAFCKTDLQTMRHAPSEIVREAFKAANTHVYQYAHRMAVGGRLGATALVAALTGPRLSLGRVGHFEGLLLRNGELVSLFDARESLPETQTPGILANFIGANAQVLVELASITLEDNDVVVLTTLAATDPISEIIVKVLTGFEPLSKKAQMVAVQGLMQLLEEQGELERAINVLLLRVGRPTIELKEVLEGD